MDKKKYEELQQRIEKIKGKEKLKRHTNSNTNLAFNIGVEIVAGVMVGLILGLFLDNLFDSKPVFLIICLTLAIIAAFKFIWNKYIKKNGP